MLLIWANRITSYNVCYTKLLRVADVGIGEGELGIVLVNGRHAPVGRILQEGDALSLFP